MRSKYPIVLRASLPFKTARKIRSLAEDKKISVSSMLRRIINKYLENSIVVKNVNSSFLIDYVEDYFKWIDIEKEHVNCGFISDRKKVEEELREALKIEKAKDKLQKFFDSNSSK